MALYPGATFKPTPWGGKVARNKQGRGILHVAVSNAKSLPPWSGNTWHFYVAKAAPDGSTDGSGGPAYCEQYIDTEYRAATSADANDDAIGVETAGGMGSSPVLNAEPWTRAQELRIADIMRWEAKQPGGAPLDLLPDSKPGRRGWGPHRLGIEHSAGVGAVPGWLVPGGERWSSHIGKECPGDAKVRQIPGILEAARGGAPLNPDGWLDMADARTEILTRLDQQVIPSVDHVERMVSAVGKQVAAVAAKQAATDEVLRQLATGSGAPIDMAAIEAVVEKGVADAISSIETTVNVASKG